MNHFSKFVLMLILGLGLAGCNTVGKVLPPNDEVLVYKLPYDLTYLRTLDAMNSISTENWQLEETDKEKGIISVRDMNYSRLDDSDLRVITFLVKRVDRETTSVSIDPKSQKVFGGKKLLETIGGALGREIKS
jgi:MFS superfamily sulfate permease-like transporter